MESTEQSQGVSSPERALRTDDLDYALPARLIATRPAEPRDSARMLVMRRSNARIEHRLVRDLPEYVRSGDALVFNTSSVAPARLIGRRAGTAGRVEGLFLREMGNANGHLLWRVMLKAGGRLRAGDQIELLTADGHSSKYSMSLTEMDEGEWDVELHGSESTMAALDKVGRTPLPPYILKARGEESVDDELDRKWYQTVYADLQKRQSVAAPTAGLHFTSPLLEQLKEKGVVRIDVTLHVGAGTFKPITCERIDQHRMHSEWFEVSAQAYQAIQQIRESRLQLSTHFTSPRIIGIGTTAARVLESIADRKRGFDAEFCGGIAGMTDLLIVPPYEFKLVDGMLTNFHLPRTTLLALVAAMVGLERLKAAYREAVERGYRFYSYGDAMLILP